MHRDDESLFLLYIEPKKEEKLSTPIDDMLTEVMEIALEYAISGTADYSNPKSNGRFCPEGGWNGFHSTDCGKIGGTHDYLLRDGHITNILAPFYMRWYRNSIPKNDLIKIADLIYALRNMLPYDIKDIDNKIKELRNLNNGIKN